MTSLEVIEDEAFAYTALEGIKFNDSLKEIRERAFIETKFKDLMIPDSVTLVADDSFFGLENLERLYLGKNLKTLGNKAFYNAQNLLSIEIASISLNDLKTGNDVFTNAGKVNGMQVYFLDGVKTIPSFLFFSTSNINSLCNIHTVSLPNSLTKVGKGSFYELKINRVNYRGTQDQFKQVEVMDDNSVFSLVDYGGN